MPPCSGQNYSGGLVSCEDGVAKGWLSAGRPGPCLVIVSLDGVPAGAGASRIGGAGRQTFAVELDAARIARGGKLSAELVAGHFRAVLPGELSVAAASPDFAAAEAGGGRIGPFRKHAGLRVTGWIAVKGRGAAPELCGGIGGKRVLMSRPSVFSPEAWKAGGQLASGYEVTFPVAAGGDEVVEAALFDDAAGLTVWQGGFDSHDCLIEDIRHITETGACRFGNNSPAHIAACVDKFCSEAAAVTESATLALRLINWMRVCQGAELSFAAALQLNPAQLARQMPGQFLEAAAALVCGLPSPLLDGAMAKLESAFEPMPSDRVKSFLLMLAQTRLRGLDDGGERIVRVLDAMNYSQSALNWVWEAVAASDACIDAAELRQLIEFEIIARNVPFSTGYALRAVGQA